MPQLTNAVKQGIRGKSFIGSIGRACDHGFLIDNFFYSTLDTIPQKQCHFFYALSIDKMNQFIMQEQLCRLEVIIITIFQLPGLPEYIVSF